MPEPTDTEVAVGILRAYAAGGKDRPGRPAICIAVEHIDQLTDPDDDLLCGCGDGLSARQEAQCGNCIAADLSTADRRYEAMTAVARKLHAGWRPGKRMAVVMAGSPRPDSVPVWMPPTHRWDSELITTDEQRALADLEPKP